MIISYLVWTLLCANRHFTGVTVTFYRCFGRFTGFRDGQGETAEKHSVDNESGRFCVLQGIQVQFSVFLMHQDKTCKITNYL